MTPLELLDAAARDCGDDFVKARIDVVRMLLAGIRDVEVARMTNRSLATVRAIRRRFDREGVAGLRDKRARSRPLDAEQRALVEGAIREANARGHGMSAAAVRDYVRRRWDKKLSHRRAMKLLASA